MEEREDRRDSGSVMDSLLASGASFSCGRLPSRGYSETDTKGSVSASVSLVAIRRKKVFFLCEHLFNNHYVVTKN